MLHEHPTSLKIKFFLFIHLVSSLICQKEMLDFTVLSLLGFIRIHKYLIGKESSIRLKMFKIWHNKITPSNTKEIFVKINPQSWPYLKAAEYPFENYLFNVVMSNDESVVGILQIYEKFGGWACKPVYQISSAFFAVLFRPSLTSIKGKGEMRLPCLRTLL